MPERLLVVDDEQSMREWLTIALSLDGFEVGPGLHQVLVVVELVLHPGQHLGGLLKADVDLLEVVETLAQIH